MARAVVSLSSSVALFAAPFQRIAPWLSAFWREMTRDHVGPYRPERYYMRGPGPKWRAKHGHA